MVWFAAFSVYPHLSGADHAVDARLGNPLELPGKEIINALPRVVRQDFNVPDAILSIRFSIQIQLIDRLGKGCYIAGLRIVALELANTSSVTPVTPADTIGKCHWKHSSLAFSGPWSPPFSLSEHAWSARVRKPELDHPANSKLRFRQKRGAEPGKNLRFMQQPLAVVTVR